MTAEVSRYIWPLENEKEIFAQTSEAHFGIEEEDKSRNLLQYELANQSKQGFHSLIIQQKRDSYKTHSALLVLGNMVISHANRLYA